ncbi:MAG: pyridoxal phosphate-dependent aminotransferase [Fusobacteriaceae bacterium]|jgi:cystathionine beta-lyase|nr:pyridoxal phosphate-dependent aminotransferase [Fusobacteriaceae bacterium]
MDKTKFLENHLVRRHGTNCYKWDDLESKFGDKDLISMWVADMDFKTSEHVVSALMERISQGVFGYSNAPAEYWRIFSDWMETRHHFLLRKEWVRFSTGCVTGIAWAVNAFTNPGDACLILTPVYYPFHNVVTNNKRKLVKVDLTYHAGHFSMDFQAIEKAVIENDVKMFIQCSPHNPAGRVWTEEELEAVLEICKRHNVLVVSDEIHQDITMKGHPFIPAAAVRKGAYAEIVITLNSASKTFNLASLPHSHIIITNEALMKQYDDFASALNRTEINVLAVAATMAAYQHGGEWLDNALEIIGDNYDYLKYTLNAEAPDIATCALEGTYLAFLDMRKCVETGHLREFIQDRCRLAVDYGEWFGENWAGFVRLNLATDPAYVRQAVRNIVGELKRI